MLDHRGEKARLESAKLLLDLASSWQRAQGNGPSLPLFLGGDFNSTPDGAAYKTITEPGKGMTDIFELVPGERRYGNEEITYTSFGEPGETPSRIDFLFVKDAENIRFFDVGVLSNRFDDKVYLSDHRAVVADMGVPRKVHNAA